MNAKPAYPEAMKTQSRSRRNLVLGLLGTTQQTSSPSSNKTSLLTLCGVSRNRRSFTNMLMVTTSVRMIDWVHGNTTSLRPGVTLDSELMLSTRCLQHGLVSSSTTSNDTNHTTGTALDDLLCAGWELDTSLSIVRVVSDDGDIVARGSSQRTTVSWLLLNVRDDSSFRDGREGEDVSDGQGSVFAGIDKLASVHPLVRDKELGVEFESVRITEHDLCERSPATWVVDDLLHNTSNVSLALRIVQCSELRNTLAESGVRSEDGSATLSLVANNSSHLDGVVDGVA